MLLLIGESPWEEGHLLSTSGETIHITDFVDRNGATNRLRKAGVLSFRIDCNSIGSTLDLLDAFGSVMHSSFLLRTQLERAE
jgi:hypothetical protein